MTTQLKAKLRVCASCEWIFEYPSELEEKGEGCPKCGFASYGARFVYGDKCYRYKYTQEPWKKKKIADYSYRLEVEIKQSTPEKLTKLDKKLFFLEKGD